MNSQDLIEQDKEDEETGRMEQIYRQLLSAYCQFPAEISSCYMPDEEGEGSSGVDKKETTGGCVDKKETTGGDSQADIEHPTLPHLPIYRLRRAINAVTMLFSLQNRNLLKQRTISS